MQFLFKYFQFPDKRFQGRTLVNIVDIDVMDYSFFIRLITGH